MPRVDLDTFDGAPIFYAEAGTGPAIVLLHGLYQDAGCWDPLAEALASRYRVIHYDLRGCGRSGDGAAPSVAQLAADLGALLDSLNVERAAIVGHSLGGQAALQFAVTHPSRVRALVLAAVSPFAIDPAIGAAYGAFAQLIPAMGLTRELAEAMIALVYSADSLDHGPAGAELLHSRLTLGRRSEELIGAIQAYISRPALDEQLAAIGCPTLIVTGDLDTTVSLAGPQLLNQRIAGSELVVLPDASHMAPFERPEQFRAALTAFLDRAGD